MNTAKVHFDGHTAAPVIFPSSFVSCGAEVKRADWATKTTSDTDAVTCTRCIKTGDYGIWQGRQQQAKYNAQVAK